MPPLLKRQKLSEDRDDEPEPEQSNPSADDDSDASGGFSGSDSDDNSDDDIEGLKPQKSRQTKKRKIRASGTSTFGATLQSLLNTDAPSTLPLSLKPSVGRKRNDEKLELRAKKVLQVERKEKEDKGRITDVIGGWGGEGERALRKVAQRGGMSIFYLLSSRAITIRSCQWSNCSMSYSNRRHPLLLLPKRPRRLEAAASLRCPRL